jgi:hypothetical protein
MSKPDVMSLLSRLVDLLTRLFTERVELARGELQEGARTAGRRAVWMLAGGLVLAVGLAFFAGAAVEALAPLVHNRALRLCLVGLPLVVAGGLFVRRGLHVSAGALPDDTHHHRDQRQGHDDMGPGAERIPAHQPQQ